MYTSDMLNLNSFLLIEMHGCWNDWPSLDIELGSLLLFNIILSDFVPIVITSV